MTAAHEATLQAIRTRLRDRHRVATCLGFGPRFLHSTGQAYKGGPEHRRVPADHLRRRPDLPVPGQRYTFGVVKAAQARGDLEVLAERGRRALRVHLGADVAAGLRTLGRPSRRRSADGRSRDVRPSAEERGHVQIGMIGLGRMGGNMARRLMRGGHGIVAYATDPRGGPADRARGRARRDVAGRAGRAARAAARRLGDGSGRRADEQVVADLGQADGRRATSIIDGGNSFYKDDVRRAAALRSRGSTTWTSARAAASGDSSAATAS